MFEEFFDLDKFKIELNLEFFELELRLLEFEDAMLKL